MGVFFSRPGRDAGILTQGAFPAGNVSSLNSSSVVPYLGFNTGLYGRIPADDLPPIPYEWMISPNPLTKECPNAAHILTWFGVTEAVVALLMPLLAYRPWIHQLSRGYLGRRTESSIYATWTIAFISQLVGNAIAAGLVHATPGYEHLNMLHIFTVYMSRPRFYFVILAVLRCIVRVQRPRSWDVTKIIKRKIDNRVEFPYTDACITTCLAELLLLLVSAIFTGVTWHRYPTGTKISEFISDHVNFVSSTPVFVLLCLVAFIPAFKRYGEAFPTIRREYTTGKHWGVSVGRDGRATVAVKQAAVRNAGIKRWATAVVSAVLLAYITLVQWAYWSRFLELPGVLFCPPRLVETGVVWGVFTLLGVFAGAAS